MKPEEKSGMAILTDMEMKQAGNQASIVFDPENNYEPVNPLLDRKEETPEASDERRKQALTFALIFVTMFAVFITYTAYKVANTSGFSAPVAQILLPFWTPYSISNIIGGICCALGIYYSFLSKKSRLLGIFLLIFGACALCGNLLTPMITAPIYV